jgi:hypothetical protein
MPQTSAPVKPRGFGATSRPDAWWVKPLCVFLGLSAFVIYATWAAFQGNHYHSGPYLSPFYSPELFGDSPHSWFGPKPGWWPESLPWSPAFFILWGPGFFRLTCYYYRGTYYRAFWADPPSCAVGEPRARYLGENSLPLILQNVHRYFLYVACLFLVFLAHDVWKALWFEDPATRQASFGLGLGTIVLAINVALLSGYTFGCFSMRHLVGGCLDQLSRSPVRKKMYDCSTCLNGRHGLWAWLSLFAVAFADIYVRLCSMGIWHDWRVF